MDPGRVRRLLELLAEYRHRLASLRDLPLETYLEEKAFEGRYLVQASAQACVDIANHLISSSGWRAPRELKGCTPTQKLKRKPIAEKYAEEIEALYAG